MNLITFIENDMIDFEKRLILIHDSYYY